MCSFLDLCLDSDVDILPTFLLPFSGNTDPPAFGVGFGDGVVCNENTFDPIECAVCVGSTASLDCTATGNPQPTVAVASNVSESNFRVDENNMVNFTDIVAGNAGIYTCTATNGIGANATKIFLLTVTGGSLRLV